MEGGEERVLYINEHFDPASMSLLSTDKKIYILKISKGKEYKISFDIAIKNLINEFSETVVKLNQKEDKRLEECCYDLIESLTKIVHNLQVNPSVIISDFKGMFNNMLNDIQGIISEELINKVRDLKNKYAMKEIIGMFRKKSFEESLGNFIEHLMTVNEFNEADLIKSFKDHFRDFYEKQIDEAQELHLAYLSFEAKKKLIINEYQKTKFFHFFMSLFFNCTYNGTIIEICEISPLNHVLTEPFTPKYTKILSNNFIQGDTNILQVLRCDRNILISIAVSGYFRDQQSFSVLLYSIPEKDIMFSTNENDSMFLLHIFRNTNDVYLFLGSTNNKVVAFDNMNNKKWVFNTWENKLVIDNDVNEIRDDVVTSGAYIEDNGALLYVTKGKQLKILKYKSKNPETLLANNYDKITCLPNLKLVVGCSNNETFFFNPDHTIIDVLKISSDYNVIHEDDNLIFFYHDQDSIRFFVHILSNDKKDLLKSSKTMWGLLSPKKSNAKGQQNIFQKSLNQHSDEIKLKLKNESHIGNDSIQLKPLDCNFLCSHPGRCGTQIKKNCKIPVPQGLISHKDDSHSCKEVHLCLECCPICGAYCSIEFDHVGFHRSENHNPNHGGKKCDQVCSDKLNHAHRIKCLGGNSCLEKVKKITSKHYKEEGNSYDYVSCDTYWGLKKWKV